MNKEIEYLEEQLEDFDDDAIMRKMREERIKLIEHRIQKLQDNKVSLYGEQTTVTEKDLLKLTTTLPHVIVHFFHPEFHRCKIVDRHLDKISKEFYDVKFLKIEAKLAPFIVEKLKIMVLPCIVVFRNSTAVDYVIGFDDLGAKDDFTTKELCDRLMQK